MKKVLIIEDEEELIDLLQKKLIQEGYEVEIARDGEEGLAKIRSGKPDLILLDIVMPKLGGFEVLEVTSKDESIKSIPIIVISNSGQPVEINRAIELGVKDYLIKVDFTPKEVLEKVKKQIGEGEK